MSRWILAAALLFWSSSALALPALRLQGVTPLLRAEMTPQPSQLPGVFDAAGIVGMPLLTLGFLQLGHWIDTKRAGKDLVVGSTYAKLFFVVGTGAMLPALYGLAKATRVPVTWGSAAVGLGFGTLIGVGLLGIDAGLTAALDLDPKGFASGALVLATVAGWAVASTLLVKADPFHLTRPATAQMTAPLVSMTF